MMKVRNILMRVGVPALLAGIIVSCGGGGGGYGGSSMPPAAATIIRSASLNGAQAGTTATGIGRGAVVVTPTMDINGARDITGGITFTGLTGTPTAAHIHRLDGTAFLPLDLTVDTATGTIATATIPANTKLSANDYAELLAGYLYFNVHTPLPNGFPNGEIRGQITGTTGVTAGLATLNGAQETPPNASTATGQGTIVFDSASPYEILICYVTHNVTNTTVAHVHTGAPGQSGLPDVVNPLTQGTNIYTVPVATPRKQLTPQNVTDFSAGNTYFNVHSSNSICGSNGTSSCSGGEIRGQIAVQ